MKKTSILVIFMGIILILGSFKNRDLAHRATYENKQTDHLKDYGFYVGYFWATDPDNPPLLLGKIAVYARDVRTGDSPVLTGKITGPREDYPVAFAASGAYQYVSSTAGYVSNFNGYVTYGGEQYHIQYTGDVTFP